MSTNRIIGIDFGTSTSVIRVKRYEDGKPVGDRLYVKEVKFGNNGLVPTLIRHIQEGEPYYGYDAQKKHKNSALFENFKIDLESEDAEKKARARALTEEFFQYLARQYKDQSTGGFFGEAGDIEKTLVSYPVKWSGETRSFMLEAARKAGFPNVEGMDEAQAAIGAVMVQSADYLSEKGYLYDAQPVNILMADMGAGTTDLVLCRYTHGKNPKYEVLSTWPKDGGTFFGGREMEELLMEYLRGKLPPEDADAVMKRCSLDKFKSWKEDYVSPALKRREAVTEFTEMDNITELLEIDVEEYALDRSELEKLAVNYLRGFPILVNGCLRDAGIQGSEVDLVLLTGGHSQWYFVAEQLTGSLSQCGEIELGKIQKDPGRIIPVPCPQETVALGLVYSPLVEQIRFAEAMPSSTQKPATASKPTSNPVQQKPVSQSVQTANQPAASSEGGWSESERVWPVTPEQEFLFGKVAGGYEVTMYLGDREVVSIPSQCRGEPIVKVASYAFSDMRATEMRIVEIPGSVKIIGSYAFKKEKRHKTSLEKVILHQGLREIRNGAFKGNRKLSLVEFPEGIIDINSWAFEECDLITLYIPKSCQSIRGRAFAENKNLSKVVFDSDAQIKTIEAYAFVNGNVWSVKLPASCLCKKLYKSLTFHKEKGLLFEKTVRDDDQYIIIEHYK